MPLKELINEFKEIAIEAETLAFITRASELQREILVSLTNYYGKLVSAKETFVEQRNESAANACLSLQCLIQALVAELNMWLSLNEEDPEKAWNYLIDAQDYVAAALRSHSIGKAGENRLKWYDAVEKIIFPPQVFNSVAYVALKRRCSICNDTYDNCEHISGRPYCGFLCSMIVEQADIKEISVVDEPYDKRCRVTHFSHDGVLWRNNMTWRLEKHEPK